jgi:hypothetical protein
MLIHIHFEFHLTFFEILLYIADINYNMSQIIPTAFVTIRQKFLTEHFVLFHATLEMPRNTV